MVFCDLERFKEIEGGKYLDTGMSQFFFLGRVMLRANTAQKTMLRLVLLSIRIHTMPVQGSETSASRLLKIQIIAMARYPRKCSSVRGFWTG